MPDKTYVAIAGAGPLDASLATQKVIMLLGRADVVLYDRLIDSSLLNYVRDSAELIDVGKRAKNIQDRQTEQGRINSLILEKYQAGKFILRLKGGDPTLFARLAEECEFLKEHKIPFEIVPGISSISAAAAYTGIPLTHRDLSRSVAFATGHLKAGVKAEEIQIPKADTIVFFMAVKNLPVLVRKLKETGYHDRYPCALIENAATPKQRIFITDLENACDVRDKEDVCPPALFIVGEVVKLCDRYNWYQKKPLFGKKILLTSPKQSAQSLSRMLRDEGADVVLCPLIEIEYIREDRNLDDIHLSTDIVFTSQKAVRYLFQILKEKKHDSRILAGKNVISIGPTTTESLERYGIRPDFEATKNQQEGILDGLEQDLHERRFFLPRAKQARDLLESNLRRRQAEVTVWNLYDTRPSESNFDIPEKLDALVFTSSMAVECFCSKYDSRRYYGVPVFAMGEITRDSLNKGGFQNIIVPEKPTKEDLINSIKEAIPVACEAS